MGKVIIDDRWLRCDKDGNPPDKRAKQALARAHDPLTAAVPDKWRASDYGKGSRWRCRWYVLLPDGRRKQQTKKFRRLQDAEAFAAATEDALRSGKYHDARQGNRPFGEVASAWMGTKIDLRDSTYRRYERELRIHVLPRWGGVPVGRIDTESVQQWVNSLHDGSADTVESGVPLAARTIRNIVRVVFGGALEYARGMGYIVSDPLDRVVTPRIVRHDDDMVFLSVQEVEDLADAATELGRDVDGLLVRFLAYTGVRVGEATALTVGDVDFAGGRVRVSKTWSVDRDEAGCAEERACPLGGVPLVPAGGFGRAVRWRRRVRSPVPSGAWRHVVGAELAQPCVDAGGARGRSGGFRGEHPFAAAHVRVDSDRRGRGRQDVAGAVRPCVGDDHVGHVRGPVARASGRGRERRGWCSCACVVPVG